VWDVDSGTVIATFVCDARVDCCAIVDELTLIAGDAAGRIHWLRLEL
jgi:hypothetical protein